MNFQIHDKDGPARTGLLSMEKKGVTTPGILFLHTSRHRAPSFAEILLTNTSVTLKKPSLRIGGSIFSSEKAGRKKTFSISKFLVYPKDVSEALHRSSIKTNSKTMDCYIVPGKTEMIPEAVRKNNATIFIVANAVQLSTQQTSFVEFVTQLREHVGYRNSSTPPASEIPRASRSSRTWAWTSLILFPRSWLHAMRYFSSPPVRFIKMSCVNFPAPVPPASIMRRVQIWDMTRSLRIIIMRYPQR